MRTVSLIAYLCLFAVVAATATPRAQKLFETYTRAYLEGVPSGKYHGTTSVLGQSCTMDITVESSTACDIVASGVVPVNCDQEAYSYANGVISLPNSSKSGDCVHTALTTAGASIVSVTYDAASDEITATFKYSFLKVPIVLKHVSAEFVPEITTTRKETEISLHELFDKYFVPFSLQDPAGTYKGTKSVLGETITGIIVVNSNDTFDFSMAGPIYLYCPGEAYSYANGVIVATNANTPGDCIYSALSSTGATLQSITYDTSSDSITVTVKYDFIVVPFTLQHTN
eukprot:c20793_g1_i2.p1 GENE.c20793_g1_i2~~c20793_g1_i2.p1  ORF type:complete len:292 (+),score=113.80 c20793_g1_i2:23-877(+)